MRLGKNLFSLVQTNFILKRWTGKYLRDINRFQLNKAHIKNEINSFSFDLSPRFILTFELAPYLLQTSTAMPKLHKHRIGRKRTPMHHCI